MRQFKTERLICRQVDFGDEEFFIKSLNNPDYIRFVSDKGVRTVQDATIYIQDKCRPQIERLGYGAYILVRREDGEKLGVVGLFDRPGVDGVDLGFSLLPEHYKQGYMFEAASQLRDHSFTTLGLTKLSAITLEENAHSRALLEKLGFTLVETNFRIPDDENDLYLYELTDAQMETMTQEPEE